MSSCIYNNRMRVLSAVWTNPFLDELRGFPTKGIRDDQVDALSGGYDAMATGFELEAFVVI